MRSRLVVALACGAASSALLALGCGSSSTGSGPGDDGGPPPGDDAGIDSAIVNPPIDAAVVPGTTGASCAAPSDCLGAIPACRLQSKTGVVYPSGYCSSSCDPARNATTNGVDPECPGSLGTCIATSPPSCLELCTARAQSGGFPCRDQYSCFLATNITAVCLPTSRSECDPTQKGSCPVSDAGAGQTCVSVGLDPVGQCADACDFFTQNCAPDVTDAGSVPRACYVNNFAEGVCAETTGGADGTPCEFIGDCAAGLGCHPENSAGVCRPYCGGPMPVGCTNGKQCIDFSSSVPKTVVGVCAG